LGSFVPFKVVYLKKPVAKHKPNANCWPNEIQELLLRAALRQPEIWTEVSGPARNWKKTRRGQAPSMRLWPAVRRFFRDRQL
jgi:hypothetical protein